MKLIYVFISILLLSSSCSDTNLRPLAELKGDDGKQKSYLVKSGDVLMVQVWGEPRLSGEVIVRQDGRFSLPLVQDVPAEGQTLTKITEILTNKLKEFIPTVTVDISLNQSAPIVYYLSGSFFKAGEYRTDKQVTLLQAIATGGGFAPFADKNNIMLIRRVLGQEMRYQLDYDDVVDGSEPNPQLQTGDVISVQ